MKRTSEVNFDEYNVEMTGETAETLATNNLTTFDAINHNNPQVISQIRKKGETLVSQALNPKFFSHKYLARRPRVMPANLGGPPPDRSDPQRNH
jgi:hypothetical protein